MASWTDLAGYIRMNYKIMDDQDTFLKLLFGTSDTRSQVVMVGRVTTGDEAEWAMIASVFADASRVDLAAVLDEVGEYAVGGVVKMGDSLVLRHSVPLADLDIDEFEKPFNIVLGVADILEEKFMGGDDY